MGCNSTSFLKGSSKGVTRSAGGVITIPLLERHPLVGILVGDSNWDSMPIPCDELEELGPSIQDLTLNAEIRNLAGLFGLKIAIQRKFLDGDWLPAPANIGAGDTILTEQTADGYPAPVLFADRSRLNAYRIRLLAMYRTKTGGTSGARADLSLAVSCRLFCC
ncbi:MAG: hypothetical protein ACOZNI_21195 [Myxococcota bacterium]